MSFGPTNDQKQANNLLNSNAQAGASGSQAAQGAGNAALGQGMQYLSNFSNTAQAPTNYFSSLLSGNKSQSTAALAPDISRINDQNQGTLQSTSTLTPRGGGRSSTLFNIPYQGTSQVAGLYNGLRPQAASGLMGIAQDQAQVGEGLNQTGANLLNTGANYLNAGTSAAGAYGNDATNQRNQSNALSAGLGNSIFGLLTGGATNIVNGVKSTTQAIQNF